MSRAAALAPDQPRAVFCRQRTRTMARPKSTPGKRLTEVELELMSILWRLQGGSVGDVMSALPRERALAYTSVSTILRILEGKGVLAARKEGRGHVYTPLLDKRPQPPSAEARSRMLQPEDLADCAWFVATLPSRAVVDEISLSSR